MTGNICTNMDGLLNFLKKLMVVVTFGGVIHVQQKCITIYMFSLITAAAVLTFGLCCLDWDVGELGVYDSSRADVWVEFRKN